MRLTSNCIGCGKKLSVLSGMREVYFSTKDKKDVCRDCANKVFIENQSKKMLQNSRVLTWFNIRNSIEFLHYYNKGATLSIDKKGNVTGEELFCPFCGSEDVAPLSKHRGGFSAGKAVAGAVLAGGVGALAGFAGESSSKVDWLCNDCHKAFTK